MRDPIGLPRGAVALRPYDSEWQVLFERERSALLADVPEFVEVSHIGSTSVPGLAAKPIIDMQASLHCLSDWRTVMPRLLEHGYTFMPERVFEFRVFVPKGPEKSRTHYLSLIEAGSDEWQVRLRFRDALRSDQTLRDAYRDLKLRLAREHADDRAAYTAAKADFIARVLTADP